MRRAITNDYVRTVNLGQLRSDLQLMKCIPHIIKPCSQLSNSQGFTNAWILVYRKHVYFDYREGRM